MAVRLVEVSARSLDRTQSHIRVERLQNGWFVALGSIGHPDMVEMTDVPARTFKSRQDAIEAASELAMQFGLTEVWLTD